MHRSIRWRGSSQVEEMPPRKDSMETRMWGVEGHLDLDLEPRADPVEVEEVSRSRLGLGLKGVLTRLREGKGEAGAFST